MRTAASLCLLCSACSLLVVRAPIDGELPPRCTKHAMLPMLGDGLLAAAAVAAGGAAFSDARNETDDALKVVDDAGGAVMMAGAVAALVSIVVGWQRTDECQQAWSSYDVQR